MYCFIFERLFKTYRFIFRYQRTGDWKSFRMHQQMPFRRIMRNSKSISFDNKRSLKIKFLLPVRLSARQASRYYARPYTARKRAGRKNNLYTDSPQAAGY